MTYTLPPRAGVVDLPRPASATRARDDAQTVVGLASGAERRYVAGHRYVYTLSWQMLTEATCDAIEAALPARVAFTYRHVDGTTGLVYASSPPTRTPLPGTNPVKHDLTVTLREQEVRRT